MENKLVEAKKIVEEMNKETDLNKVEEMIKDNKISFEHNEEKYRVRLLNLKEKEELDSLRRKKFGQLIKDKDILLEKDLIQQYKERGINIEEINDNIKKYDKEELDLQLRLGEAISKNEGEIILKEYSGKIEDLRIKKSVLNTQKTLLLEFSLENQLLNYVAEIITYLSLDIYKEEKWKRMFNTFDEFQNYEDEKLINKAGSYSMILQYL